MPARIVGWAAAEAAWRRAVDGLQPFEQFESLASLEAAVGRCVRVGCAAMAELCPPEMQLSLRKLLKESARCGLNTLRAGLDPRGRVRTAAALLPILCLPPPPHGGVP